MAGAALLGLFCCVFLVSVPRCVSESRCPALKSYKGRRGAPRFTRKSTQEDEMIFALEQRHTLKCCVRGYPKPNITWFRDGRPLFLNKRRLKLNNDDQELIIRRVSGDESGRYTCISQNIHGRSNHTIYLDVREVRKRSEEPPVLKVEGPEKAVVTGSNITLRCQASSVNRPTMWWGKMNGTKPRILDGDFIMQNKLTGTYVLALTIKNASFDDAGVYKCLAKNGVGFSSVEKNINVSIVEREEPTNITKKSLPGVTNITQTSVAQAVGGGLALVALMLLVLTFIYIKRRKPEGWVTRKLIQMGVVKPAQCHAKEHGEDGDDECICVMTWDVFISYNNNDRAWVMNVLHERLESAYKVCVDYQDFVPGAGVMDNIARCIWRSKTTLFVVSRDFLRSGWSRTEFEITQDKIRRAQGALIVIMLEDIKWQELPPILRRYTTGKMRVDCKDHQLQPRTWRRLRALLGPPHFIGEEGQVTVEKDVPCNETCLLMMESSV